MKRLSFYTASHDDKQAFFWQVRVITHSPLNQKLFKLVVLGFVLMKKGFTSSFYLGLTILVTAAFIGPSIIIPKSAFGLKHIIVVTALFILALILAIVSRRKMRREEPIVSST